MNLNRSPRVARPVFCLLFLFALIGSLTIEASARGKHPRGGSARHGRGRKLSRHERRPLARSGRRGGRVHLSRKEKRAQRQRAPRETAAYSAQTQKSAGHK